MNKKTLGFIIFLSMFGPITSITPILSQPEIQSPKSNFVPAIASVIPWNKRHGHSRRCPRPSRQTQQTCTDLAASTGRLNFNSDDDLNFFKKCIADYYCFTKTSNDDEWTNLPTFEGVIGTTYFNNAAKRVEMFFIRNNVWSQIMASSKYRNVVTGKCPNLLYVIAARYLYVTYVLHLLRGERTFGPCEKERRTNSLIVPSAGECYPVHYGPVTCTSDYDVALIGARSGSLTALFYQFFKESIGRDPIVAGFGKTSEDLFNTNVYAFTMEYAMPNAYAGLSAEFKTEVNALNTGIIFQVQEVVCALLKMKKHHDAYYNDLNSDHRELELQPTKHNLFNVFQQWVQKFMRFYSALKTFTGSEVFTTEINFRRQHNIAYESILGIIENQELSNYAGKALSEVSIALLYEADAYHTRGAIRHVVGWTQMQRQNMAMIITDYWVSMLENWADTVKEYTRVCVVDNLVTAKCLPKISKYMWRMLDAMFAIYSRLPPSLKPGLLQVDDANSAGLRSIVSHWLIDVKKKGLSEIPSYDRVPNLRTGITTVDYFLKGFNCDKEEMQRAFSSACLDRIHNQIRKYNRVLFINMVHNDPV